MQSNGWSAYHGGGENDFTVFLSLLEEVGNHDEWVIYAYHDEKKTFIRDITSLLAAYENVKLISTNELGRIKHQVNFECIYASGIHGLEWMIIETFKSERGIVVIYGIRRYELRARFLELFFPSRLIEKFHLCLSFLMHRVVKMLIEAQHRQLFSEMPASIQLIATSEDTRGKLLAMCPKVKQNQVSMLYTSPKTPVVVDTAPESSSFRGVSAGSSNISEALILKKYNLTSKQYVLLISLSRAEKNIYFALTNLHRLLKEHALSLNIFACGEAKKSVFTRRLKKHPQIDIRGYVPTEDLTILYKHAFLFIYPSRTEGFGMPILEAMEHGTPVCCSALSPLIEVGREAAEYFSLENDLEFRAKILKFYQNPGFYEQKKQLSLARYREMTALQQRDLERKKNVILYGHKFIL